MPDYLVVPEVQRARVIHEKARAIARGRLDWVRSYLTDVLDDDELAQESIAVRYFAITFVHLAARTGWIVLDDARLIAGRLTMKQQDVRRAIDRLVELGRIDRVQHSVKLEDGSVQLAFPQDPQARQIGSDVRAASDRQSSGSRAASDRRQKSIEAASAVSDLVAGSLEGAASTRLAHARETRAEAEKKEHVPSNGNAASYATAANAIESNEIVNRIIALVARGRPQSIAAIQYEAAGLSDHLLARTLESYRGRHPKPTNGGGYVVATLRALRAEAGIPDTRPRIDREPDL